MKTLQLLSLDLSLPHIAQICLYGEFLKLPQGQVFVRDSWEDRLSETSAQGYLPLPSSVTLNELLDLGEPGFTGQENWTTDTHLTALLWPWMSY